MSELLRVLQGGGRPTPLGRAIAELGRAAKTPHRPPHYYRKARIARGYVLCALSWRRIWVYRRLAHGACRRQWAPCV
ncbi:MAG: transposase [Actinomycetota bacterium]|nr:transposase [Actinomycetota bacterium]